MHLLAPLRMTHSSVLSPFLSDDKIHTGGQNLLFEPELQSCKQGFRTIPRYSFLTRLIIFVLLEFGFIALVVATLRKPIILHLSFTITEVKSVVTAISILWHALAVYAVKDIPLNIFSAEWIMQDNGSKSLSLRELDIVSRLTTGLIDQAKYFASKRATPSFRLGFLSFLLLMSLNGLGPSAITVNVAPYNYPDSVQIANLTMGTPGSSQEAYGLGTHRAQSIIELEMIENFTTLGYHATPSNILIPWPSSDSMPENTTMTYQSDVIRYNFSCSWNIPSINHLDFFVVAGEAWSLFRSTSSERTFKDPIISPLQRMEIVDESSAFTWGSQVSANKSLVPFIFVGKNATFVPKPGTIFPPVLNLEGIASLMLPCNSTFNSYLGDWCLPLLASILLCDPQLEVLPATINATTSSLKATILPGIPVVKNVPTRAANMIFSTSLLDATSDIPEADFVNAILRQLFVPGFPTNDMQSFGVQSPEGTRPLPLQEINRNMNNALASSAKAYLSGYKPDDNNLTRPPSFATVNTSAIVEVQKTALVGSKPFLVASSVIVVLLLVLLGVLAAITRPDQLEGFELEVIVKRLQLNYHSSSDE